MTKAPEPKPVHYFLFIVFMVAFCWISSTIHSACSTPKENNKSRAIVEAHYFVIEHLKSPSTAVFPWGEPTNVSADDEGTKWCVSGVVDAQNSFGGTIRTRWAVEMTRDGDKWSLVNVRFPDQEK